MDLMNALFYLNLVTVMIFFFRQFNIYPMIIIYIIAGNFVVIYPHYSDLTFFLVAICKCLWLFRETRNLGYAVKCLFFPISIIGPTYFIMFDVPRYFFNKVTLINIVAELLLLFFLCTCLYTVDRKHSIIGSLYYYKSRKYIGILMFYIIFIVFFMFHSIIDPKSSDYIWTGVICSIIGIIYMLMLVSELLIRRQMEKVQLTQLNYKNKEGYYSELEAFRHDYNNYINALEIILQSGNIEDTQDFFRDQKKFLEVEIKDSLFAELSKIEHVLLYGLVLNFVEMLEKEQRQYEIHVNNIISKINVSDYDLTRIISNLLKNAIEHSSKSDYPIKLTLDMRNNQFIFILENPVNIDSSFDRENIFQRGYSTKRNNTGIGLYNIRKIINEYPNISIDFCTKKSTLSFEAFLKII